MSNSIYIGFILAEITLTVFIAAAFYYKSYKKVKTKLTALEHEYQSGLSLSILRRFIEYENSLLIDLTQKLGVNGDADRLTIIKKRFSFLADQKAELDKSEDDKEVFWRNMEKHYIKYFHDVQDAVKRNELLEKIRILENELKNTKTPIKAIEESNNTEQPQLNALKSEIDNLGKKLNLQQQKAENLEKFRGLYLEIQDAFDAAQKLNSQLADELRKVTNDVERVKELEELLAVTEIHRKKLEQQLDTIERDRQVINNQLNQLQSDLATATQKKTTVNFKHDVTEDSNAASMALNLYKFEIKELHKTISELGSEVTNKAAIIEKMEALLSHANEMEPVISILEDENQFLRNQLATVLKMDEESASASKVESLTRDLNALKQKYAELDERYLQLETRYLKVVG